MMFLKTVLFLVILPMFSIYFFIILWYKNYSKYKAGLFNLTWSRGVLLCLFPLFFTHIYKNYLICMCFLYMEQVWENYSKIGSVQEISQLWIICTLLSIMSWYPFWGRSRQAMFLFLMILINESNCTDEDLNLSASHSIIIIWQNYREFVITIMKTFSHPSRSWMAIVDANIISWQSWYIACTIWLVEICKLIFWVEFKLILQCLYLYFLECVQNFVY